MDTYKNTHTHTEKEGEREREREAERARFASRVVFPRHKAFTNSGLDLFRACVEPLVGIKEKSGKFQSRQLSTFLSFEWLPKGGDTSHGGAGGEQKF